MNVIPSVVRDLKDEQKKIIKFIHSYMRWNRRILFWYFRYRVVLVKSLIHQNDNWEEEKSIRKQMDDTFDKCIKYIYIRWFVDIAML